MSLGRAALLNACERQARQCSHPGWWLDMGLRDWSEQNRKPGELIGAHIDAAVKVAEELNAPQGPYRTAFDRWQAIVGDKQESFAHGQGRLRGRMLIGLGEPSLLDTSVMLHRTYGAPIIHGSQLKGIAHHFAISDRGREALDRLGGILQTEHRHEAFIRWLFGKTGKCAGYVTFHDAWWIPGSAPSALVRETVTPHHNDYFITEGAIPPSDMDDPVPSPLIAVQGAFLFAVEGAMPWARWGYQFLRQALSDQGAGARTHSDYGLFEF